MSDTCTFCGSTGPLTREHVFGQWVSKIGLDLSSVQQLAGPLNGMPRDLGKQPPYRLAVKSFCASCNNGWMSQLEVTAQRVPTPLILGESVTIAPEDQAVIAMWVQKTALTAMLISSKEQREAGYGLSPSEYAALFERRAMMRPLDASRFWVGRYEGPPGFAAVHVTPMVVRVSGTTEAELPQGYLMTIVLGKLVLQGLRFTMPDLEVEVTTGLGMPQLWPSHTPILAPAGQPCTEKSFRLFAKGTALKSAIENFEIRPWAHAADLPQSTIVDGKVRVPAVRKKHFFSYPVILLEEALQGRFYVFMTRCQCHAYLIQTGSDSVSCKAAGAADGIAQMYNELPGDEFLIHDETGEFRFKEVDAT